MKKTKLNSSHLRMLAVIYFTVPERIVFDFGICFNLSNTLGEQEDEYCWYIQMEKLMKEIGYGSCSMFRAETIASKYELQKDLTEEGWQSRAWMCLFLAEYLDTK
jgi:hypothetical protein